MACDWHQDQQDEAFLATVAVAERLPLPSGAAQSAQNLRRLFRTMLIGRTSRGGRPAWSTAWDRGSHPLGVRGFESLPPHSAKQVGIPFRCRGPTRFRPETSARPRGMQSGASPPRLLVERAPLHDEKDVLRGQVFGPLRRIPFHHRQVGGSPCSETPSFKP